jgi:hypothetical protein
MITTMGTTSRPTTCVILESVFLFSTNTCPSFISKIPAFLETFTDASTSKPAEPSTSKPPTSYAKDTIRQKTTPKSRKPRYMDTNRISTNCGVWCSWDNGERIDEFFPPRGFLELSSSSERPAGTTGCLQTSWGLGLSSKKVRSFRFRGEQGRCVCEANRVWLWIDCNFVIRQ